MMLLYPCLPHTQWCDKLEAGKAQGEGEGEARTGEGASAGKAKGGSSIDALLANEVAALKKQVRACGEGVEETGVCVLQRLTGAPVLRRLRLPGAPVLRRLRLPGAPVLFPLCILASLFPPFSSPSLPCACPSASVHECVVWVQGAAVRINAQHKHPSLPSLAILFSLPLPPLAPRLVPPLVLNALTWRCCLDSCWLQDAAVCENAKWKPLSLLLSLPSSFSLPLPLPFALPSPLLFARPLTSLSLVGVGQWVWGSGCGAVGVGQWVWGSGCGAVGVRQWVWGSGCGAVGVGQWE
ncbi:unnamed protein product [Closterium sp. NIES-65]|nr:unnamed protein product [Closterium sp. NIES-65]